MGVATVLAFIAAATSTINSAAGEEILKQGKITRHLPEEQREVASKVWA